MHAPSSSHQTPRYTSYTISHTTIQPSPSPTHSVPRLRSHPILNPIHSFLPSSLLLPLEAPNLRSRLEKRDRHPPDEVRIRRTKLLTPILQVPIADSSIGFVLPVVRLGDQEASTYFEVCSFFSLLSERWTTTASRTQRCPKPSRLP
jgi:hypothetical protein